MIYMKTILETVYNLIGNCTTLLRMFKKIILIKSRLSINFKILINNKMMIITSLKCKIQKIRIKNLSNIILKDKNNK
jgi:hypothetical protein